MLKKDLIKKIAELEARIQTLESRPIIIQVHPTTHQPHQQYGNQYFGDIPIGQLIGQSHGTQLGTGIGLTQQQQIAQLQQAQQHTGQQSTAPFFGGHTVSTWPVDYQGSTSGVTAVFDTFKPKTPLTTIVADIQAKEGF